MRRVKRISSIRLDSVSSRMKSVLCFFFSTVHYALCVAVTVPSLWPSQKHQICGHIKRLRLFCGKKKIHTISRGISRMCRRFGVFQAVGFSSQPPECKMVVVLLKNRPIFPICHLIYKTFTLTHGELHGMMTSESTIVST